MHMRFVVICVLVLGCKGDHSAETSGSGSGSGAPPPADAVVVDAAPPIDASPPDAAAPHWCMRTVAMVVLVACSSSPTHPGDAATIDAPSDAGPINHWTFNGATYSSPTATCNTPTGAYWFMSATAVETSGHDLIVY